MNNSDLFGQMPVNKIKTEGIKYAGSKQKLLPHILDLAASVNPKIVLDAFSGSTRVSQAFAKVGYTVFSNDISEWSEIFGQCYLLNELPEDHYTQIINHLNNLKPKAGWFTENYGGTAETEISIGFDGLKKPWQIHNTEKLDSIREEIDRLQLSTIENSVVLTSLIRALDEVDSTLGHYVSYLNNWSNRSYKHMKLKVPCFIKKKKNHKVFRGDIFNISKNIKFDLAYIDPPYGSNNEKMPPSRVRYNSYYHIWKTIILNDKPTLFGKAKRRADSSDTVSTSVFEEFRKSKNGKLLAVEAIEKMLGEINANYLILSYSSGGRATAEQLNDAISLHGKVKRLVEVNYKKNVMADMRWTNEWVRKAEEPNRELLFLIEKTDSSTKCSANVSNECS